MKNIQVITVLILSAAFIIFGAYTSPIQAQQAETLIGSNLSHGGFGGPVVKIGNVAGSTGVWVGGRGGWVIILDHKNSVSLGGGGYGLVTDHLAPNPHIDDSNFYALNGYGGFEIEYINRSSSLVHFTVTSLIGGGGLLLRDRNFDDVDTETDSYFVFEPGIHAELNVTNFFRIAAGASYRMTSGINRFGFSDGDFSGLNGVITFKFGKFL